MLKSGVSESPLLVTADKDRPWHPRLFALRHGEALSFNDAVRLSDLRFGVVNFMVWGG